MASAVETSLLPVFRELLTEVGWHATTVSAIAERAGHSRMTLHRRGVSKEGLLAGLSDELAREHRELMWPIVMSTDSAIERLRRALGVELDLTDRHAGLLAALDDATHSSIYHEDDGSGSRGTYVDPYVRILRDGILEGAFPDSHDPADLATVLFTMVGPTYRHLRGAHAWAPERARTYLVHFAMTGVVGCLGQ